MWNRRSAERLAMAAAFLLLGIPVGARDDGSSSREGARACDPEASVARREAYHIAGGPRGTWSGANEAQQLTLTFTETAVSLAPAGPGRPAWEWSLSPVAFGPPGAPRPAEGGASFVAENWIERTLGPLAERFVNGPKGLEHRLLLPPLEEPRRFHVDFALGGTLVPKVSEDGRHLAFVDASGRPVLAGRDLRAEDADGRDVSARWERVEGPAVPPGRLRLVVEGAGHADPIRVTGRFVTAKGEATATAPAVSGPAAGAPAPAASAPAARATVSPLVAPANDLCAGAEVIPGAGSFPYLSGTHDLTDATTTDDPPLPTCQTNLSRSVWFAFTPALQGSYAFSLCADGPTGTTVEDTVLAVYEAAGDCVGLVEAAGGCDDDSCAAGDLQSAIGAIDLSAGTRYYVVVWKYGTTAPAAGMGEVQIRVALNPPPGPAPANDRCAGAEVVPGAGPFPYLTSVTADVSGATTSGDPPPPSCQPDVSRSIWYAFTPGRTGRYILSTCADAPTGTTIDDTTMAIYTSTGPCSGFAQVAGACDDDSCASEAGQSVIRDVALDSGTTYHVVVWQYGASPLAPGNTAVQVRVSEEIAPPNDTCGAAPALVLDAPASGTTANARNDYQIAAGSTCFTGLGQTPSTAAGGDVAYAFTAPRDGRYSFRVSGFEAARNAVVYVASACPSGPAPATVAACLGAANRNAGYPGEEVFCLPLAAGQTVAVFVDENAATTGSPFAIEVNECRAEAGANDTPGSAESPGCGIEGSIAPAGDADFYALGVPAAGSRLFALVDGAAANSTDFDLRATTGADTLEYDDLNDDTPFGNVSPNVAGTPLPGAPSYLRVSHYSAGAAAEPYRLYAAVQPPAAEATPEIEPNDAPATATTGSSLYFAGALSGPADIDLFAFTAAAGDLVHLGLDLDPARDGTPFNGILALLDVSGTTLVAVNDGGSTSTTTPGTSSLSAATPGSPGEGIVHRARVAGTYFARVGWSGGTPGDYLLSIARNCRAGLALDADGDGVPDGSDCAPGDPSAWSVPGEAAGLALEGSPAATDLRWSPPAAPGGSAVLYDVLRGGFAADWSGATCVASGLATTAATDPALPGGALYYLIRSRNVCGGNTGARSDGTPRTAPPCP